MTFSKDFLGRLLVELEDSWVHFIFNKFLHGRKLELTIENILSFIELFEDDQSWHGSLKFSSESLIVHVEEINVIEALGELVEDTKLIRISCTEENAYNLVVTDMFVKGFFISNLLSRWLSLLLYPLDNSGLVTATSVIDWLTTDEEL